MSKRWSKLQHELYLLLDEAIHMQIHCSVYRMNSQYGSTDLPRYWITLGKDIIFDYPQQFLNEKLSDFGRKRPRPAYQTVDKMYPYITDVNTISNILREYIDTPIANLLEAHFDYDNWGLTDILKAADRRIGKQRLKEHFFETENGAVQKILTARQILFKQDNACSANNEHQDQR